MESKNNNLAYSRSFKNKLTDVLLDKSWDTHTAWIMQINDFNLNVISVHVFV